MDQPGKVHFWVALSLWMGPTLLEAGLSLDRGIRLSQQSDHFGPLLYRQHRGKPGTTSEW